MLIPDTKDLIPYSSIGEMCSVYQSAAKDIRTAFAMIEAAEKRLQESFGGSHYYFSVTTSINSRNHYTVDAILKDFHKTAWGCLLQKMELHRFLSDKASKALSEQIEKGENLPEIEKDTVLNILQCQLAKIPQYITEAIKEVYESLRPWRKDYKTNSQFEIGPKVILTWRCESKYNGSGFHVSYRHQQELRALDSVFHSLDGNGIVKTPCGPLVDAINQTTSDGRFETSYFKGQCYHNRNLHLSFKRLDLLQKLNEIGGGVQLRQEPKVTKETRAPRAVPKQTEAAPSEDLQAARDRLASLV